MDFKIDENLPVEVADLLRQVGYDAVTVFEQHLEGASEPDIASVCQQGGRALITLDTDFADIRAYPPAQFPGLIVLRCSVAKMNKPVGRKLAMEMVDQPLDSRLTVLEKGQRERMASPNLRLMTEFTASASGCAYFQR